MKKYYDISKLLIKQFAKEKTGSVLLELLILLSVFGMCAAVVSPTVKDQLAEMFDNQSEDITFGGERGDVVITATPQTNALPAVDATTPTSNLKSYKFRFDGTNYVKLPMSLVSFGKGSSDFTFEGWINSESTGKAFYFGKNSSVANGGRNNLELGEGSTDTYIVDAGYDAGGYSVSYNSGITPLKNQKVHLVWSTQGNVVNIYIDGTLVWTKTIQSRNTWDDSNPPQLGMEIDNTGPSDFFRGYMYEVRLYNRALTQVEVSDNKNGNITSTGLLAEYLFEDGAGSVITDQSGNGNNATIVGNPLWVIQ